MIKLSLAFLLFMPQAFAGPGDAAVDRFLAQGNVGIGSASPGSALDVTGNIRVSGIAGGTLGSVICLKSASGMLGTCGVLAGVLCTTCN